MREPKWTRAAYAAAPAFRKSKDGSSKVVATVDCWRGTVEELCSIVESLLSRPPKLRPDTVHARILWIDGTNSDLVGLKQVEELLKPQRLQDVLAIRFDSAMDDAGLVSLVARQRIPGLVLQVEGNDPAFALGAAELAFRRMMAGYVDRMGGLRALTWMLFGLTPMILVSWAVGRSDIGTTTRLLLFGVAVISGFSMFRFSGPRLLVGRPLVLLERIPDSRSQELKSHAVSLYSRTYVKVAAGVAGSLFLGVLGNKLADLIPFP
ncbi:hypothetical protein [Actinoplanes sp. NPDC049265]|uniref:hypothetical protein n=1 Tax=Actinoplanes sp. NPDC049265 TaxID=3363902 RepID=UPI003720BDC6